MSEVIKCEVSWPHRLDRTEEWVLVPADEWPFSPMHILEPDEVVRYEWGEAYWTAQILAQGEAARIHMNRYPLAQLI